MRKILIIFIATFFCVKSFSAVKADSNFIEKPITLHTATGDIFGTLTTPKKVAVCPVALIISGSGPTDRNGNNSSMKNDGLKQLAHALAGSNIASVRFDKRGIAASSTAAMKEEDLRFENYVIDAEDWITLLKKDRRFSKVIIIGHSEGSLIGMIAIKNADKFVSVAGAGRAADVLIKEQLITKPQELKDIAFPVLDSLKAGKIVEDVNPMLASLFRKSVQPYMISWFKYDPQEEIKKLTIPVLIVQGTNDLQVKVEDAAALSKANPAAKMVLIDSMNHVLKIVSGDSGENIKSYNDPSFPLSEVLIKTIIEFIKMP